MATPPSRLFLALLAALLTITIVAAQPHPALSLPATAREVSPGLYYLGSARDHGRAVEGYAIVRYARGNARPPGGGGTTCYTFLAKGAKWKTVEPYLVNPANVEGLSSAFVTGNLAQDIDKWELAAGMNIVGTGSATSQTLVADTRAPDNQNEVYFGNVGQAGAIAVTIVWGIFSGPVSQRELVEWDQVFDQTDFNWSGTGEPAKMDFESLATHELGHTMGLGDIYQLACAAVTMYGYASEGETNKRTLEAADIAGISALY